MLLAVSRCVASLCAVKQAECFQARDARRLQGLRAARLVLRACVSCALAQAFMKADFDSWRVAKARLDFCAPLFPDARVSRPRVLHSRHAHFAAPSVPSKAQSKRAQRPQAAQFPHLLGSYGAPGPVKASVSAVSGVKITGFNEFIARKMS